MLSEADRIKALEDELAKTKEEFSRFVYVASHDLNEPLRKVLSFGDMLKTKYSSSLDSKGQDYIERMQSSSKRMQSMLNSLLQYSRTNTSEDQFENLDLNHILDQVKTKLRTEHGKAVDGIESENLSLIEGNLVFITQLFEQLLDNALRYQKEANQAKVKIEAKIKNNSCEINIIDNGIGFDLKYRDKIFSPFERLHGRSSPYQGAGLGLAICKAIVDRHSGLIEAFSREDEGTLIKLSLPVKQH